MPQSDRPQPRWFHQLLTVALLGLLGFSVGGMVLAMLGAFRPIPVTIATVTIALPLLYLSLPRGSKEVELETRSIRPAFWAPVLLLVLVAGWVVFHAKFSSQHLLTNRDPGVYVVAGQWLANEGNLLVDARVGPFAESDDLVFRAAGMYDARPDGKLYFQFLHLLPVILAAGSWIGGSLLLVKVNAIIGGLALVTIFAFGSRIMRPWLALGATAALGLNLVQVHFSRDAYSEILSQVFLFGGLWMLWAARTSLDSRRGFLAGLLLGATCMVRVDAFVLLLPFVAYLFYEYLQEDDAGPWGVGSRRKFVIALAVGIALTAFLGWLDGRLLSPVYLSDLEKFLRPVFLALGVVLGLGIGAVFLRPLLLRRARWFIARRKFLAASAAVILAVGLAYAYFLRPVIEYNTGDHPVGLVGGLQEREGLPVDPTRTYAEFSLRWIEWYLGPFGLVAGLAGWALMTKRAMAGEQSKLWPFLLAFSASTALYLWRPSITPDHIWAMRRFLPVTIPGMALLCFWMVDRMWEVTGPRVVRTVSGILAAAVVLGALAFPAATLAPVPTARTQSGLLGEIETLCEALPDNAVVVTLGEALSSNHVQTVRSFCGVPAAAVLDDTPPTSRLREFEARARRAGWEPYVLSSQPDPLASGSALSLLVVDHESFRLERTIERRPDELDSDRFQLYLTPL